MSASKIRLYSYLASGILALYLGSAIVFFFFGPVTAPLWVVTFFGEGSFWVGSFYFLTLPALVLLAVPFLLIAKFLASLVAIVSHRN